MLDEESGHELVDVPGGPDYTDVTDLFEAAGAGAPSFFPAWAGIEILSVNIPRNGRWRAPLHRRVRIAGRHDGVRGALSRTSACLLLTQVLTRVDWRSSHGYRCRCFIYLTK
jgi:hypothetical protein